MGKKNSSVKLNTISHPNSRKVKQLIKQNHKVNARDKSKLGTYMKQNLLGEKLVWFQEHIDENLKEMTANLLGELINLYLSRFDDELDQIKMKHSLGQRKGRQHASREDIIKSTKNREREEYLGPGIELVDVFNNKQLELLKTWSGEIRYLPNFILKRFNKDFLAKKIKKTTNSSKETSGTSSNIKSNEEKEKEVNNETADIPMETES